MDNSNFLISNSFCVIVELFVVVSFNRRPVVFTMDNLSILYFELQLYPLWPILLEYL